ncbi:MAG: ClpX C4-type zinc finger protein, partial [Terriglobia bacterium]
AEGPVRVLLPPDFETSFEASIAKDACFVCRADIGTRIAQGEQDGRTIFRFGQEPPAIRLVSLKGPMVIDSRSGACGNVLPLSDNMVSMFGLKTRGKDPTDDRCSFCSKPRNKVINLVANPSGTAYICNECIEACFSVLPTKDQVPKPHRSGD